MDGTTIRVGVMGAGAVGSYFGVRLAQTGVPVTLVARPAHVEAITRDGLELTSAGQTTRVPVTASSDVAALQDADVVLVCVKSVDTEATAVALGRAVPAGALLVSLQNGVDNAWRISAQLANPVVPAAVYVSAEMTGPGRLRHNGGGSLVLGRPLTAGTPQETAGALLTALVAALGRAGVPCRESADIRVDLWTKLAANCAYNAMSALAQLRYRHLAADEGARDVMRMVTEEIAAVAQVEGVAVTVEVLAEAVRRIAEVMPEALSSTAQDLLLGRRTENRRPQRLRRAARRGAGRAHAGESHTAGAGVAGRAIQAGGLVNAAPNRDPGDSVGEGEGMDKRVVVITGASSGIGAALAERLAGNGDAVALVARRADALQAVAERCGHDALVIVADMTSRADAERAATEALARFGHIDVWVNNVGRGITRAATELTDADIDEMMLVNVKSALYGMQAVLPHFKAQRRGHIINVSSMLGRMPLAHFRSAYNGAKHFLNALTANVRA